MPAAAPLVVLWDIDGTLLRSRGMATRAYRVAVTRVTGREPAPIAFDLGGRTEPDIAANVLRGAGVDEADIESLVAALLAELEQVYAELGDELRANARLMPGVVPLVDALAARGAVQTVVTGNVRRIARQKLDAVGLAERLDLAVGGYGSDHIERARLVELALERVARSGVAVDRRRCWVIGDTPRDAACAEATGVRCLLVATGSSAIDALHMVRADAVAEDLSDTTAVLALFDGAD